MYPIKLQEIADATHGTVHGNGNELVSLVVTDSRNSGSSTQAIFVAIKGARHDGHFFIEELIKEKGFRNFVVNQLPENAQKLEANFIVVADTLICLQQLAKWYRRKFNCPIVAVSGSNGKTIVKEWLYQLLHADRVVTRSPRSYNSQIGVPLSILNLSEATEIGIFEAGISEVGEMQKLAEIINPEIGIFTNIGQAHQENFQSLLEKAKEKLKLFANCKQLIYCSKYNEINQAVNECSDKQFRTYTWSVAASHQPDLLIKRIVNNNLNTEIEAEFNKMNVSIRISFTDKASIENAIHCWLFMLISGYSNNSIKERFAQLNPVEMRLELKKGIRNCTIINDSYNSDLQSVSIALDFLNQQYQHTTKTLIISDIFQSGKDEDALYKELGALIGSKNITKIIGVGKSIARSAHHFNIEKEFFLETSDLIDQLYRLNFNNEAILIKGSRKFEFDKIASQLEQKAHRTVMEINLSAMVHNLNYFRSKLKPNTKLMVMVKAFSYGSGTYEIANMLNYQKVDYLAVAFADEGVLLRNSGIKLPIVVMNPEENAFRLMIEHQLEPEIYSFRAFSLFTSILEKLEIVDYPIHIKFDTGMHRLGFLPHETDDLIALLRKNNKIRVKSVFTHLAGADEEEHDAYTEQQNQIFQDICQKLQENIGYTFIKHLLNSAGIERFNHFDSDMARLGIGLYGISAEDQSKLRTVSTLKSYISQIKTILKGQTVGYSRKGKTNEDTTIAVIPIGYADGLSRRLSNGKGYMYVNGQKAPIIGNVCMDICMLNINGIKAHEGDEVEIFGNNIHVNEVAQAMDTIPYEVLTSISPRVKRIYYQE